MKNKYNILVTGCGGDIGLSIGKILKSHPMFDRVIGCDMSEEHAGKFIFDETLKINACSSDNYLPTLEKIVKEYGIDIIVPMSEPELRMLTEKNIETTFLNKKLICANIKSRQVGFDKLATVEFLKNSGLPYPETQIINEVQNPVFPLILKSRAGSGSKSIFILKSEDEFNFYKKKYPDFIVQELLVESEDEFTCGVYRGSDTKTMSIIYKRKLFGDYSGFGIVIENDAISKLLEIIAEKINLLGSINVQLKFSKDGPCVFEINPRFSSTVKFRHMMGFQDLIWSIEDALGMTSAPYNKPLVGTKFYKGFQEYVQ